MPIINLSGDSVLKKEEFVKNLNNKLNAEYIRIYPDYSDKMDIIKEKVLNTGLFSSNVIIDIINFDKFKSSEKKEVLSLDVSSDVYIILRTSNKINSKKIEVKEFKLPNVWEKDKWKKIVFEMSNKEGLTLNDEVIDFLFENVGPDEMALFNEIRKLKMLGKNIDINIAKEIVHKYTTSKLDEFCFLISERKKEQAMKMIKDIAKDYEPVIVVHSLSTHFISLLKILSITKEQSYFSWPAIQKISKELKILPSKVARFVGFKFKGQKNEPVNHLLIYDKNTVSEIIKKLYYIDRNIKTGALIEIELINFINF